MTEGRAAEAESTGEISEIRGKRSRPLSNASFQAASSLIGKGFSFIFLLYAFHVLSPGLFGNYTIVLSFVGLFGVLTELGMGTLAVRDVSQNHSLAVRYISNLLLLRGLTSAIAILLIVVLSQEFVASSLRSAVYVYALALLPIGIGNSLTLVFQFSEQLWFSAVISMVTTAVTAGLSILALFLGFHVLALVLVYTVVNAASTAVQAWIVYTRFLPRRFEWDPAWWPVLIRLALPFMALTLLNVLYYRADTMVLSVMSGCNSGTGAAGCVPTGDYGAAYRVLDALVAVFVGGVNTATLPAFNRVVTESREALRRLLRTSTTLALVFGLPVALLVTFYAPLALRIIAGRNFMAAAPALAMLVWAFPCFMVVGMYYNALYALHKQSVVMVVFAVTLVFNVALNIALIPYYSFFASSALTVASEVLNIAFVSLSLRRNLGPMGIGPAVAKMAAVLLVATAVLWALQGYGIFVGLPAGIIVLALGVRVLRVLGQEEHDILGRLPAVGRYARFL